ncbi:MULTISPECIES: ADP-ribosylglycohydrolase family protein [unclassified Sphingomonas]|uniref:ADP-ribosylglycohydrolase family protein n=1 Tax=unclassified Sphingomonas TaxID=196159 RepID=UPI002269C719|nr:MULTISPECIES: ADP-ribosylglycohydrolase family protein [unclassified Sphingomonas]
MSPASIIPGSIEDRAVGCLLGGAIGDALGVTNEFVEGWRVTPLTRIVGGGWLKRKPGEWTDDTAMSIALAMSLADCGGLHEEDFLDRLRRWLYYGDYSCTGKCDDVGLLTRAAITNFSQTRKVRAGRTDIMSAGNGSLVRMAPIAIRFQHDLPEMLVAADCQSRCTHGAPEVIDACRAFGTLLVEALNGGGRGVLEPRAWDGTKNVSRVLAGSWRGRERSQIDPSGWVVATLLAAIWSVATTRTFEDAVLRAANLGGDADSIAATAGQLAGAIYGASAIGESLSAPIAWRDQVIALALRLAADGTHDVND